MSLNNPYLYHHIHGKVHLFGGVHIEAVKCTSCRGSYYMLDVCSSSPSSEVGDIRDLKMSSLDVHIILERILGPGQNQRGGPDIDPMCGSCSSNHLG